MELYRQLPQDTLRVMREGCSHCSQALVWALAPPWLPSAHWLLCSEAREDPLCHAPHVTQTPRPTQTVFLHQNVFPPQTPKTFPRAERPQAQAPTPVTQRGHCSHPLSWGPRLQLRDGLGGDGRDGSHSRGFAALIVGTSSRRCALRRSPAHVRVMCAHVLCTCSRVEPQQPVRANPEEPVPVALAFAERFWRQRPGLYRNCSSQVGLQAHTCLPRSWEPRDYLSPEVEAGGSPSRLDSRQPWNLRGWGLSQGWDPMRPPPHAPHRAAARREPPLPWGSWGPDGRHCAPRAARSHAHRPHPLCAHPGPFHPARLALRLAPTRGPRRAPRPRPPSALRPCPRSPPPHLTPSHTPLTHSLPLTRPPGVARDPRPSRLGRSLAARRAHFMEGTLRPCKEEEQGRPPRGSPACQGGRAATQAQPEDAPARRKSRPRGSRAAATQGTLGRRGAGRQGGGEGRVERRGGAGPVGRRGGALGMATPGLERSDYAPLVLALEPPPRLRPRGRGVPRATAPRQAWRAVARGLGLRGLCRAAWAGGTARWAPPRHAPPETRSHRSRRPPRSPGTAAWAGRLHPQADGAHHAVSAVRPETHAVWVGTSALQSSAAGARGGRRSSRRSPSRLRGRARGQHFPAQRILPGTGCPTPAPGPRRSQRSFLQKTAHQARPAPLGGSWGARGPRDTLHSCFPISAAREGSP
ncbi:hypothetical protein P7K49_040236 [Saguinus oedipus]|uniref:Uncharacterized protein n=1 Tax=Saguinus oedipus TaxID=9490 RepID=A0ABQ9T8Q3_SAGOE|nr:hypothetical protein P7K49_040236 [Saguinus oedipus]